MTDMTGLSRAEPSTSARQRRLRANYRGLLLILAIGGLPSSAVAHPGAGIAVDRRGQVYFLDTGSGLWKVDTLGRLTHLSRTRFHWLALDEENRFANTRLPSGAGGEIVRVGTDPVILLSSDYPIAIGKDGNLYYQTGAPGRLRLMRMTPSAATSVATTFPPTVSGESLTHIGGIVGGPDGSLYYTEDAAVRRIDARGRISTVAVVRAPANPPSIPAINQHPYLRGLAVDDAGVLYVGDTGDGRVLRITAGTVRVLLQTRSPWSPTAVALRADTAYVLEYLHTAREVREDWLPRVRRIAPDGASRIIATIDQMPGAR